ncbi:MAG: acyl carrier protein [Bacteroidales bacterium]|nr:acyl carrier protein [Bacteroidales bacterium]MCD8394962.1 acyl carrier protein [Bacteroidales bacterium]
MEEKVIEILREVMDDAAINAASNQDNTENWDSMHQLMLVAELEDAFDLSLEPEEIAEMRSVADILRILNSK